MSRPTDATARHPQSIPATGTPTEPVISRALYRPGPLRADCERLSRPTEAMTAADILSFLLKYFHASLYPGSENHALSLEETSALLGRFYDLWRGGEAIEALPGKQSAYPLRMLADLPRTAHIFRSVANRPLIPTLRPQMFCGLDLGTGSGILLAAAWLQAKRNRIADVHLIGVDYDRDIAARTNLLLRSLGMGEAVAHDARDPEVLARLPLDGPLAFVANENVPAPASRVTAEPFSAIHAALFAVMAKRLRQTIFFPEALVARDQATGLDIVLSKNNRFQPPRRYRELHLRPRSIVIEGRLTRLWQVGKEFRRYVPEPWLRIMPGRW